MSIRPVDLQVIIPKAAETSNQNQSHTRQDVQQQHFSEDLNKQIERNTHSVIQTNKSDKQGTVDRDGKNKQENQKKRKRLTDKKEEQEEKKSENRNLFDVRI